MRTRTCACRTHVADYIALLDILTDLQSFGVLRQVQIGCLIRAVVANLDGIAATAFVGAECHYAITQCHHRRSCRRSIINACMWTNNVIYRVLARVTEVRGYTLVVQRRFQKSFPQTVALLVVVVVYLCCRNLLCQIRTQLSRIGIVGRQPALAVIEMCRIYPAYTYACGINVLLVVQHAHAVALLQGKEVNRPRINLRQL